MSIWDEEFEDYEMEKAEFECWLDSLAGEGTDEEKYNEYQDSEYEKWLDELDEQADQEAEIMSQAEYPEWMIKGQNYMMTVSNN